MDQVEGSLAAGLSPRRDLSASSFVSSKGDQKEVGDQRSLTRDVDGELDDGSVKSVERQQSSGCAGSAKRDAGRVWDQEEVKLDNKLIARLPDFQFPFGTVPLEDGTTVLSETRFHRLRVLLCDGTDIGPIGERGNGPGRFEEPRGLCALDRAHVAVADTGNARVQIIRVEDGRPIRTVSAGKLQRPWDVAVTPDGRLFICDMGKNTVLVFSTKGILQHTFRADLFDAPCRIEFHPHTGHIHVADKSNSRVHLLSVDSLEHLETKVLRDEKRPW